MSLGVAARIARRELRGGLAGFRVFLACLALGVAAIAAVGTVRGSIDDGLHREGKAILGGDAQIELTYRFATPEERSFMNGQGQVSEIASFRSMAVFGQGEAAVRGLTEVKSVDDAYPLVGQVRIDPPMPLAAAMAGSGGLPGALMDPVLIDRLGMKPGDTFRLGLQDFRLMAAITREPDDSSAGFALGPRTLVRTADLARAGLLEPGTLYQSKYRILLAPGVTADVVKARAQGAIEGGAFRWRDARDGVPGVQQFIDRLSAFLVLTGLAGLAVGGVGISAAVRAYLDEKRSVIATLKTLGADGRTIFQVYFLQIGLLALLGVAMGLVLGAALPLVALPLFADRLPVPADAGLQPGALAEAALYGLLSAGLFTLWPLARSEQVRAAALYRDAALGRGGWPRKRYVALTALLLALLVGSAAWLTGAARLTLYASGGLLTAFLALVLAGLAARAASRHLARGRLLRGHPAARLAFGAVGGPGGEAVSVVLSLGLGLAVLAAIGQIDTNLRSAIAADLPRVAPSFFVVDIQQDELGPFKALLEGRDGVKKVETAPMLRGVITGINGRPAAETAGKHWVIQGDRGVTYSETPPENTTVTAGKWWPEGYQGKPQASFSANEAREIGLKIGDTITVNILGRDITADVTSLREVKFQTAGIGFVIAMNPAALQGAPHTHIATIYAEADAEASILRDVSNAFPNITLIRVRDAIDRVTEVLGTIAAAVTYGALATLATGGVVLVGAAAAGERARTYEAAILKTIGASRARILASFALRSVILGTAAGVVAALAGGAAGWAVSRFVMETGFVFAPLSALEIILGGIGLTLVTGLLLAWRPLSVRPAGVLRARE